MYRITFFALDSNIATTHYFAIFPDSHELGAGLVGESHNADTSSSSTNEHQMNIYHSIIAPSANSAFDSPPR